MSEINMNNTREISILTIFLTHVYYENNQKVASPSPSKKNRGKKRNERKRQNVY